MKFLKALTLSILITFISCSDDDQEALFQDEGIVTGQDLSECACCGGWFIEIRNQTYRFYELPPNTNINLATATFPIEVELDWMADPNACLGDEIIVERIREAVR